MPTVRPRRPLPTGLAADRLSWVASAALFVPLLLLLLVAVRTWSGERRYAAVTHKVLHDYAGIAAWQYSRRANMALHDETMQAFQGIARGHMGVSSIGRLHSPEEILADGAAGGSVLLEHARFAFTYDVRAARFAVAGGTVDSVGLALLEQRLLALTANSRSDDEPHRVLFDSIGGAEQVFALWVLADPDRPVRVVYGVASDPSALQPRFTRMIGEADLFPAARLGSPSTAADIAVRLTGKNGAVVFATPQAPGATAATDSATLQAGELLTTLDLSPRLANALLVGGAPPSQLPSLALMIGVAAVLAVLGLRHAHRTRELDQLRGRFVANVSHELRTPLAQISMFAETLALGRERNAGERRHFASIIVSETRRLTGLVESVLRFSRLEARQDTLRLEVASVAREAAAAVETFAPVAAASGVTIAAGLEEEVYARLDRAAFRQILLNLLDNAVKHGGYGASVWVSVERRDAAVQVVVDDSGAGIPEPWRERVFDPYVRAAPATVAGAGIGLAVVRDLVVAHGGRVWIEQSPRGGARFIVTLAGMAAPVPPPLMEPAQAAP